MDYNRPFFTPDDISIPIPNPGQHPSAPVQMLRRENYHLMHNPMTHSMMALSGHVHAPTISPVEDTDELDTSSRPRLTQEQIATLEDNFKGRPKPDTDFKKHLASQIGLSLQRVNVSFSGLPEMFHTHNPHRTGIRTAAPKRGTRSPRKEALMFCRLSLMCTGQLRILSSRTSKLDKINLRMCRSRSRQAI